MQSDPGKTQTYLVNNKMMFNQGRAEQNLEKSSV